MPLDEYPAPVALARVVRGGLTESVHLGHVVVVGPDGTPQLSLGAPDEQMFARSALKPVQAVAMVRSGLSLSDPLLALVCASHNGEPRHLEGTRLILDGAGLQVADLQNTPDLPYGAAAQREWLADGHGREAIAQNCSGKHAGMLATCVTSGWPTETYLEPDHPLQTRVRSTVVELTGDDPAVQTIDGCGAPLFSCTLTGLARAFSRLASASDEVGRVGAAMAAHPEMVAGADRDVTTLMSGLDGVVAKDGAEGVYTVGLPDGRGIALKIADGSPRACPVVIAALLRHLGLDAAVLDEVGQVPVLGHGRPVGQIELAVPGWSR
ncbi:MAG: asparaginase [Actinomycetales bacterium]